MVKKNKASHDELHILRKRISKVNLSRKFLLNMEEIPGELENNQNQIMTENISLSTNQRMEYPKIIFSMAEKIRAERVNI